MNIPDKSHVKFKETVIAYICIRFVLHPVGEGRRTITYKLYGYSAERLLQGYGQDGLLPRMVNPYISRLGLPAFFMHA
jgi:hypothetical protein